MNRGALTALIIILIILVAFVLLYRRAGITQTPVTPSVIPTTGVGSQTVSPTTSLSPTSSTTTPTSGVSPTKAVSPSPTTY